VVPLGCLKSNTAAPSFWHCAPFCSIVTVWVPPMNLKRTVSPAVTVRESGKNLRESEKPTCTSKVDVALTKMALENRPSKRVGRSMVEESADHTSPDGAFCFASRHSPSPPPAPLISCPAITSTISASTSDASSNSWFSRLNRLERRRTLRSQDMLRKCRHTATPMDTRRSARMRIAANTGGSRLKGEEEVD